MSCIDALHEPRKLGLGPMQGPNRVPPEILHDIFEQFRHDKKTLSSGSSVSRYWREVALPLLFAHISIPSAHLFAGFLEFVHTHPHLGGHVRKLTFHPHIELHPPVPEDELRTFLSSAISRLPSIRNLSLTNVELAPDGGHSSTPLALIDVERKTPSSFHLQQLSILCSIDTSCWTSILIWFLSRCTVNTLKLVAVEIVMLDDSVAASTLSFLRNSVRIPKLVLDASNCWSYGIYPFLEAVLKPGSVRTVSVSCESSSHIPRILSLMGAVGQNVTSVSLDLANFTAFNLTLDLDWTVLGKSLTCCPCLESLHIRVSTFSVSNYSGFPCHAVFTTLLPYASRMLQTLTVELVNEVPWYPNKRNYETWDLKALDAYLTRKPAEFPSLRGVHLELRMPLADDNESLVEFLLSKMPALKDAGLLRLFCDDMTPSFLEKLEIEPLPTRED